MLKLSFLTYQENVVVIALIENAHSPAQLISNARLTEAGARQSVKVKSNILIAVTYILVALLKISTTSQTIFGTILPINNISNFTIQLLILHIIT